MEKYVFNLWAQRFGRGGDFKTKKPLTATFNHWKRYFRLVLNIPMSFFRVRGQMGLCCTLRFSGRHRFPERTTKRFIE
jgi:hypothetical protein